MMPGSRYHFILKKLWQCDYKCRTYFICTDLLLSRHSQLLVKWQPDRCTKLLPQGGNLSVLLHTLRFDYVVQRHCLLSGSTFTLKLFNILLQLMWMKRGYRIYLSVSSLLSLPPSPPSSPSLPLSSYFRQRSLHLQY